MTTRRCALCARTRLGHWVGWFRWPHVWRSKPSIEWPPPFTGTIRHGIHLDEWKVGDCWEISGRIEDLEALPDPW